MQTRQDQKQNEPAPPVKSSHATDEPESTSRLEAFSDGVFAVAITLLVLDIKVPLPPLKDENGNLTNLIGALWAEWPTYMSYLTSFVVIGIIWINHHAIFRDIRRTSHMLLILNLLLLLCVSLIPFPTALLAQYIKDPNQQYTATAVYSGVMLAMGIVFLLLGVYVERAGLLRVNADPQLARTRVVASVFGTLLYAISFVFAFFNVAVSIGIYAFVALMFLLLNGINLSSFFSHQRRGSQSENT